ncbi:hypothetical protein CsatA_026534 [Cannabis sativa]
MAVLTKKNLSCYSYCSYYYSKKAFFSTYEDNIFPLADSTTWDVPDHIKDMIVLPPTHKRPAGRPKKTKVQRCAGNKNTGQMWGMQPKRTQQKIVQN